MAQIHPSTRVVRLLAEWPFTSVWGIWTLASLSSLIVAIAVTVAVVGLLHLNEDQAAAPIVFPTWFALTGVSQAAILSRRLRGVGWWPVATGAGWLSLIPAVWVIQAWFPNDRPDLLTTATTLLIVGLTTGIAQWLVLRRQWRRAGWWPVASATAGVILALVIGSTITDLVEIVALAAIPGAVTGLLVAWMFSELPARDRPLQR